MGPLTFGKKEEQIFLGREIAQRSDYSEDTALRIDQEVKRIVIDNYQRALRVLQEHRSGLQALADALLAREVLDADQVRRIVSGQSIDEPPTSTPQPPPSVVDDRARKESRPGFVPPLGNPLPQE
jgi:cell division protease FtsH